MCPLWLAGSAPVCNPRSYSRGNPRHVFASCPRYERAGIGEIEDSLPAGYKLARGPDGERFDEATMAQTLARRVFRRTGGHPLFSLVDYFVSQRGVLNLNAHWTLAPDDHVFREGTPRDPRG
jgi:hypothetical protein